MNFDFKSFLAAHPALISATDSLTQAILIAAEDAAKAAISSIPVVGGIVETVASPALDGIEKMVEAKIAAALAGLTAAPAAKPVPVAVALVSASPQPGGDPRMAQKQADAAARAAATTENGQVKPTTDFGQGRDVATGQATVEGTSNP